MEAADNNEFFESQWRQAFDGASVTPPPMVWERVEARLATQKEGKYRKAIFYYRWAAAAMTTVAVGLGAALWLNGTSSIAEQEVASAATMESTATEQAQTPELREMKMENEIASSGPSAVEDYQHNGGSKSGTPTLASVAAVSAQSDQPAAAAPLFLEEGENTFETSIAAVTGIFRSEKLISNLSKIEVDHLYGVVRPTQKKRKELGDAPLLAGLGIGSGTFDPNYGFRSGGGLFNNASADETSLIASSTTGAKSNDFNYQNGLAGASTVRGYNESNGQGGAFSFGASVGKRIFRRLLLQTGLQYGRYNSNGTTNLVLNDKSNNKRYALNQTSLANESVQDVFATSQYSYEGEPTRITSTYEFISVPVKLGVILLDRRTGVVLNTGVSNDFLVSNLIKSKDNDIEEVKTKSGDSSPYKKMYVNGTVGLEVNYAINNHYKVVVEPYYRQALTSLTKNADGYSSSPRLWGVQAGVRYELR